MNSFKTILSRLEDPKVLLSLFLQFTIVVLSLSYSFMYPQKSIASANGFLRLDRQSAGAALAGVVCEKSSLTAGGVQKVIVAFPSTFSLTGANTTWTIDTTAANMPNGASTGDSFTATAWPGINTVGGPTVVDNATKAAVFTSSDLTNASLTYCFHFTAGTSTVGTTGSDKTGAITTYSGVNTSTAATVETLGYATAITNGANSEQIQVTASVSATFSFALSGGATGQALPLGVLNSGTPVTTPYRVTATISTNATNGFLSWVKSANAGLLSNATSTTIAYAGSYDGAPSDLTGTTGVGVFGVTGTNAPTIAPEYNTTDAGNSVGFVSNTSFDLLASKTGNQSGTTFTIGARAKPAGSVPAGTDYTDTLTVVASGSF